MNRSGWKDMFLHTNTNLMRKMRNMGTDNSSIQNQNLLSNALHMDSTISETCSSFEVSELQVIFGKENRFLWLGKINSALLFSEECLE
jgi:hypothetical protein